MAFIIEEGSQTTVVSTEHTLNGTSPQTTDSIVQVFVDLSNMQSGDTIEFRIKEKTRTADTQQVIFKETYNDAQDSDFSLMVSPSLMLAKGWDVTLKQTTGTSRSFPWSIRRIEQ